MPYYNMKYSIDNIYNTYYVQLMLMTLIIQSDYNANQPRLKLEYI